jgi:hypothetical protein
MKEKRDFDEGERNKTLLERNKKQDTYEQRHCH